MDTSKINKLKKLYQIERCSNAFWW